MNLSIKKIFATALFYGLFIGVFFIGQAKLASISVLPNQDLTAIAFASVEKNIALTFDDGPYGTSTEKILNILKEHNVHATFFVMGKNVEKYPDIAKRMVNEGNLIENHSYDHAKNLPDLSTTTFHDNVQQAESAIIKYTGLKPRLFRPPYGKITGQMYGKLERDNYTTVMWNIDALDWDHASSTTDSIEKKIVAEAKSNGIILLHDGRDTKINYPRDNTINALPYIIKQLKQQGYTFVTVDKIINTSPYF